MDRVINSLLNRDQHIGCKEFLRNLNTCDKLDDLTRRLVTPLHLIPRS